MRASGPALGALALGALAAISGAGCTDRSLFRTPGPGTSPIDDRLTVQAELCTSDPQTVEFPVKVLFVVDTSQSMNRTDPLGHRLVAVREVVDAYARDPGVSFGIIQFAGATNVLTQDENGQDGFTRDLDELYGAIVRLGVAEQTTDYEGALANTIRVLASDMGGAREEELTRSKYVVVFLSDGLPNPVTPPANTRSSILARVAELTNLRRIYRPGELRLHTALLLGIAGTGFRCTDRELEGGDQRCTNVRSAAECAQEARCAWVGVEDEATALLEAMAIAGGGTFRSFRKGEEINFLRIDFTSIRRVFTLKNLIASNQNARPGLRFEGPGDRVGRAIVDSDGDGLSDDEELALGTDPLHRDTDGDGFSDFLEVRLAASGFDPLDPTDADCRLPQDRVDSDGDGLLDCEERFVGTSKNLVDSDADGFPDGLELLFGTNPAADDTRFDLDFDGARNGDELRGHSDPAKNDAAWRSSIAYRYDLVRVGLGDLEDGDPRAEPLRAGRSCYEARIENVTLAETAGEGRNRIYLWAVEAPFDDPEDVGTFRVACVEQVFFYPDFRDPPYPAVHVPESAFRAPGDFDPERDCAPGAPARPWRWGQR